MTSQYHQCFREELGRLNPAQKKAVEQTEGPVLVVAGPGTGKTHILAARIGQILLSTDTSAQSILCLTFTDAGVRAMRERLLQLIGPEAHRVHIYTFHSFCNTVIQDNLAYFGRQGLEPVSELEQIELTRQILDGLPITHPLRRGKISAYFYEKHLRDLFQLMKTEGWTPSFLQQAIKDYLEDLPQREAFRYKRKHGPYQAGDVKESKLATERDRMTILEAAVELFPAYERGLAQLGRYDYADMILWVLKAFRENEQLLRNYQEQYLYFLVDEYQDTNGAQNELLHLMADFWDSPNLFIVGDDDQSIFEFQGARLKNLVDYYHKYEDEITVVLLQQNYRSTQAVLDAAGGLIQHNEQRLTKQLERLGIEKELEASLPERKASTIQPELRVYPNTFQEEVAIIQEIERLHEAGVPWQEMAVIYARHQQVKSLQNLMDKHGIPYQTRRKTNVLDTILIRQLREMLIYLKDEQTRSFSGDHRLFKILHYPCFGIEPLSIARLAAKRASLAYEERPTWREWIQTAQHWPDNLPDQEKILAVAQWWEKTHAQFPNMSLPALVEHLLSGSGLLTGALKAPDRLWQVQLAKTFLDVVREEVARRPRLSLNDLLRILDQMDTNRLSMPMRKDIELEDGVHLVTAHSSKGLEFNTVFLLDATKNSWEGNQRRNQRFALPDTLTLSGESFVDETRRRLFYVAVTRAKERLFISYGQQNHKGKEQLACQFVDELSEAGGWIEETLSLSSTELLRYEITALQNQERPQLPAMEQSAIAKLLTDFQLSPSSWQRYLDCPLRFFYEVVLQVPQIQRPAASYGNALHNALQKYFNLMLAHPERIFPEQEILLELFNEEMERARSFFSPEEYIARLAQGKNNLSMYYTQYRSTWTTQCRTELRLQQVEVEGVPIKGVIDRIDFLNEQEIGILDYKSGSHNNAKLRAPTESKPNGGNYWRQLAFYKMLWENRTGESRRVRKTAISYLDLNKAGELTIEPLELSTGEMQRAKAMLKDSYQRIKAQDFYTGCGEESCEWCAFVREDMQTPSHTAIEVEELDDK
ncbi:MAG: ATP-dependent DNA helicase [Bacteroidota bacterium]